MTDFEPRGGFPPIIRIKKTISDKKILKPREFAPIVVNISNIMNSKKKEDLFTAFNSDYEGGANIFVNNMFNDYPNEYAEIKYINI